MIRILLLLSGMLLLAQTSSSAQVSQLQQKIDHIIVIYQENWSFDGLFAYFPNADGARGKGTPQVQCPSGGNEYAPLTGMPPALILSGNPTGPWPCGWQGLSGGQQDPHIPLGMPVKPYNLTTFIPADALTGDLWHIFWHEQLQIDNGALEAAGTPMGKFVAYSSNPGLVFGYYNATHLPEGVIAQHYTLADHFFHSAYGGSYLNHQWLICACTPQWNQPLPANAPNFVSRWNPSTHALNDGNLTTMPRPGIAGSQMWVVNTTFTRNSPHPSNVPADQLHAPIPPHFKTIGDLLTDHTPPVSWKWYSGGWNLALAKDPAASACANPTATKPNPPTGLCFQYHHQPFAYYQRWGTDGSPEKAAHLQDETNFFADLKNNALPSVVFVKPVGYENEHPRYAALLAGQKHVARLLEAICESPYWKNSIVIITYDENGGRWDHVKPPKVDEWGPGTRVPAILVSPYVRAHYVDHTQYETASILSLIEKRFDLPALGIHDRNANPMLGAFDFNQAPLACQAS
jgi:acid phosphatase